jgi:FlaA1/EpsC-like NDP-sugar epimerase
MLLKNTRLIALSIIDTTLSLIILEIIISIIGVNREDSSILLYFVAMAPSLFLGFFHSYRFTVGDISHELIGRMLKGSATYGIFLWLYLSAILASHDKSNLIIGIFQPALFFVMAVAIRMLLPGILKNFDSNSLVVANKSHVCIYGAGEAGRQLMRLLKGSKKFEIIGFIDDDPSLNGRYIDGVEIFGIHEIGVLKETTKLNLILLAIPSINRERRNQILCDLSSYKVKVRTLPKVLDLVGGKVTISDIRELDVEDLLGRDLVPPSLELLEKNIKNKVVLISGAGGSIGSELARQALRLNPEILILLDHNEFALYKIDKKLSDILRDHKTLASMVVPIIGSVHDEKYMNELLSKWRPHIIYHAAAYKHVHLVEKNPNQGIYNNVFGTWRLAKAASKNNVSHFVLISTDKAVRPTSVMGASKRIAEIILQAMADSKFESRNTIFSMVRFGNVLDSSGSVVPLFKQQFSEGGPITITHRDVTRYFMTIPEAAELVIQASSMASGGEVYVLDMGAPVKIVDLARRMAELLGLTLSDSGNPDGDIEMEIIGLRKGEKLYEELLIGSNPRKTMHPRILSAQEEFISIDIVKNMLVELDGLISDSKTNEKELKIFLKKIIPGYKPNLF